MPTFNFPDFWVDSDGDIYRLATAEDSVSAYPLHKYPFMQWDFENDYWSNEASPGQAPYKSCKNPESKAEWKPPAVCVAWAMQNLGRAIEFEDPNEVNRYIVLRKNVFETKRIKINDHSHQMPRDVSTSVPWPNSYGRPVNRDWSDDNNE